MSVREPILKPVAITDLRPTQMTVGIREVEEKRKRWHAESKKKGDEFLGKHMIPVVLGPEDRHYVIDHHHLARALHEEGVENILVTVVENLRTLKPDSFWFVLDNRSWMHRTTMRAACALTRICRRPWPTSLTIRSARWRANCDAPAGSPRTRRRSANSCGRIFCVDGSSAKPLRPTSSTPSSKPWNCPKRRRRAICPAGVVPSWTTIEGTPILREKSTRAPSPLNNL